MSTKLNELSKMNAGNHFTHVTVGNPSTLAGKVFVKEDSDATSTEVSFGSLDTNQSLPFFHKHKQNEETYIVLTGAGIFQADEETFPIEAGSVVRISPEGVRSFKCTSIEPLSYICIQAKAGSLAQFTMTDGELVEYKSNLN